MIKRIRQNVFNIIERAEDKNGPSWWFDIFISSLIAINALAIILESYQGIKENYIEIFYWFELVSVIIFSIEYILRVWSAIEYEKYKRPFKGRLKFMKSSMALIDLLAILPFYLAMFPIDLRFLRILRLFRIFRLFKIVRYVDALSIFSNVFKEKKEQLVVSTVFILFLLLIVSSLMFFIENPAQPEAFSSIPETMWWGVATLSTVGYGDVYPITSLGKVLGGLVAILGIGLFALPTGILASGFSDELSREKEEESPKNFCPNCGQDLK